MGHGEKIGAAVSLESGLELVMAAVLRGKCTDEVHAFTRTTRRSVSGSKRNIRLVLHAVGKSGR